MSFVPYQIYVFVLIVPTKLYIWCTLPLEFNMSTEMEAWTICSM